MESATEGVATVRLKLKRMEYEVITKKAEESIGLSGAFEQSVVEELNQIMASVSTFVGAVKEIEEIWQWRHRQMRELCSKPLQMRRRVKVEAFSTSCSWLMSGRNILALSAWVE